MFPKFCPPCLLPSSPTYMFIDTLQLLIVHLSLSIFWKLLACAANDEVQLVNIYLSILVWHLCFHSSIMRANIYRRNVKLYCPKSLSGFMYVVYNYLVDSVRKKSRFASLGGKVYQLSHLLYHKFFLISSIHGCSCLLRRYQKEFVIQ